MKLSYQLITAIVTGSILLSACAAATPAPTQAEPQATLSATSSPTQAEPAPTQPAAGEPTVAPTSASIPVTGLPAVDPSTLEGDIVTAGSSTVYPLAEAVIDNFHADGFAGEIKLDSIGSGGGFERFCKTGETDVANASRPIKDSEKEACQAIGRTPIEFLVGLDALSVVVNNENTFAQDLTIDQLGAIFTGEANKWSDVNPDWPAETIQRFTPGTDSGTFDFFVETVVQKPRKLETLDEAKALVLAAPNLQTSEDDNVLVQGVEGSPYAIGYFGFAYYKHNEDRLKAVSVNSVAPDEATAEDGSYPLSRPLFLYSDAKIMQEKPQVAGYINYFLTNVNQWIGDVGYFPASQERMQSTYQNWLTAVGQ
jgi:phosphate transport system substrate-binding protein